MADTEVIRGIIFDLDTEVKRLGMKLRIAVDGAWRTADPQHESDFQAEPNALALPWQIIHAAVLLSIPVWAPHAYGAGPETAGTL
jgi:hypothetical protein